MLRPQTAGDTGHGQGPETQRPRAEETQGVEEAGTGAGLALQPAPDIEEACAEDRGLMDAAALTAWALSHGWQLMGGHPSLVKPSNPKEAIVRLVLKATVVNLEVKKPAGKWEKVAGAAYGDVHEDEETGLPRGLGLDTINGLTMLMQDNKDRMVFAKLSGGR